MFTASTSWFKEFKMDFQQEHFVHIRGNHLLLISIPEKHVKFSNLFPFSFVTMNPDFEIYFEQKINHIAVKTNVGSRLKFNKK